MSYIGQKPAERVLTSADISDAAITADKLASSSVTQPKVNSGVAGTGPAFAVYASNGQSCSGSTSTKITLANVRFDTNSNFSSSRFTPTVAGYYQISGAVTLNNNVNNAGLLALILKNGNSYASGSAVGTGSQYPNAPVSALVYLNGSTDYVELYVFNSSTTATVVGGTVVTGDSTFLTGALVRAA